MVSLCIPDYRWEWQKGSSRLVWPDSSTHCVVAVDIRSREECWFEPWPDEIFLHKSVISTEGGLMIWIGVQWDTANLGSVTHGNQKCHATLLLIMSCRRLYLKSNSRKGWTPASQECVCSAVRCALGTEPSYFSTCWRHTALMLVRQTTWVREQEAQYCVYWSSINIPL